MFKHVQSWIAGNGGNDEESLRQEIEALKHHLHSNYAVYVRRLEKKKTRIKEMESLLREVTGENEKLSKEIAEIEGMFT